MKAFLLFTSTKRMVILTSYNSVEHPELLRVFGDRGIVKFVAYELSIESTKAKYGASFDKICSGINENNDIRILDYSSENVRSKFSFDELSNPIFHTPKQVSTPIRTYV